MHVHAHNTRGARVYDEGVSSICSAACCSLVAERVFGMRTMLTVDKTTIDSSRTTGSILWCTQNRTSETRHLRDTAIQIIAMRTILIWYATNQPYSYLYPDLCSAETNSTALGHSWNCFRDSAQPIVLLPQCVARGGGLLLTKVRRATLWVRASRGAGSCKTSYTPTRSILLVPTMALCYGGANQPLVNVTSSPHDAGRKRNQSQLVAETPCRTRWRFNKSGSSKMTAELP